VTVIVEFPDGTDQVMSNWYYRRLGQDVLRVAPDDAALNHEIEAALKRKGPDRRSGPFDFPIRYWLTPNSTS
jgi:hypothetical protein